MAKKQSKKGKGLYLKYKTEGRRTLNKELKAEREEKRQLRLANRKERLQQEAEKIGFDSHKDTRDHDKNLIKNLYIKQVVNKDSKTKYSSYTEYREKTGNIIAVRVHDEKIVVLDEFKQRVFNANELLNEAKTWDEIFEKVI